MEKKRGPWRHVEGFTLKKQNRTKQKKTNNKEPQRSVVNVASLWPLDIQCVRFLTSKGPHYHPQVPRYPNASPKMLLEWAALSATYIPYECFSLLHFNAQLIWRTLFSRRLWPCLYFDIRCKRKPLCPLFSFHLCTYAVNLRVVLAPRSMEYLLAYRLLGEAAAYQLGL